MEVGLLAFTSKCPSENKFLKREIIIFNHLALPFVEETLPERDKPPP